MMSFRLSHHLLVDQYLFGLKLRSGNFELERRQRFVPVGEYWQNSHYFVQNATFIFLQSRILSRPQLVKIPHQLLHVLHHPHISAQLKERHLPCTVL